MSLLTSLFPQKIKTFFKKFRKFNALNEIDKKMLDYINYEKGFYIECGANDGVDQSNTYYYEKFLNWNGILIEPLDKKFAELKKNRCNKNIFINSALVASKDTQNINIFEDNLKSKITLHNEEINERIIKVKATTLSKILNENKAPSVIDFFSLDVEGYEEEVLKGIDFNRYKFKFILIETSNPKIFEVLKKNNYKLLKKISSGDYLFQFNF